GSKFLCSEVIAPIRSEVDDISLIIINFEDLTTVPAPSLENSPIGKNRLSKFDRARASFRQSLRLGSGIRGRGLRLAGYLTPPSDVTAAEEEEDRLEQCPLTSSAPTAPILDSHHQQTTVVPIPPPSAVGGAASAVIPPLPWSGPGRGGSVEPPGPAHRLPHQPALSVSHSAPASHQASFERGESMERTNGVTNGNGNGRGAAGGGGAGN
ncbi:unnamed protein product, partial [Callosobruchus maculatus]